MDGNGMQAEGGYEIKKIYKKLPLRFSRGVSTSKIYPRFSHLYHIVPLRQLPVSLSTQQYLRNLHATSKNVKTFSALLLLKV
jgi:hypothetical protein